MMFWIKTGVWLVTEQVLGIHDNSACDGNTLLHTSRNLTWKFVLGINQVYAVKTFLSSFTLSL